jgi:hypothetical protein
MKSKIRIMTHGSEIDYNECRNNNEWESLCHQIIVPEIKPPSPRCPQAQRGMNNFDRQEGKTRSAQGHEFMQDNFGAE